MDELKLIEIINDNNVIDIIENKNHLELAKYIGKKLCNFSDDDEKYVDLFWESTFNKSWLYLSDEIIINWMGYKKTKSTISNFVKDMKIKYKENIDYIEVNKSHKLVKYFYKIHPLLKVDGNRKKYYIITGETLKKMLLRAGTKQGDMTCDYFIKIENLANITNQAIFKFIEINKNKELQEKNEQIAKLENKQLKLESFVRNIKLLDKNQLFYIATSQNYARQNRFEYGGVKDAKELKGRLATYNTGRAEGDLFYYCKIFKCNNYKLIEERIGNILQQFKDKFGSRKEMIHLRYNLLVEIIDFICDNYDREIEYINSKCQEFLNETIEQDSIIPEPIDLSDYLEITVNRNGQAIKRRKIDITDWDDNKINEIIEKTINLCANEKKKIEYNYSNQKNSLALELTWGLLTPYLNLYDGLSKMDWRNKFKGWYEREKPKRLKIRGIKLNG